MASKRRIAVLSYLVLFIMMKDGKSDVSLAGNLGNRVKRLEEKVKALEETCMDKCKREYTEKECFNPWSNGVAS